MAFRKEEERTGDNRLIADCYVYVGKWWCIYYLRYRKSQIIILYSTTTHHNVKNVSESSAFGKDSCPWVVFLKPNMSYSHAFICSISKLLDLNKNTETEHTFYRSTEHHIKGEYDSGR